MSKRFNSLIGLIYFEDEFYLNQFKAMRERMPGSFLGLKPDPLPLERGNHHPSRLII